VSIELPEAMILAEQMNSELLSKRIRAYRLYRLKDHERLQRIGFMNKDVKAFDQLLNARIVSVTSRGNAILIRLSNGANLILSPEYGGEIFYHSTQKTVPEKYHLRVDLNDDTALTVRLTSMGGIHVVKDGELSDSYVYKRDFNLHVISPMDDKFTSESFLNILSESNRALKSVLVGKDAAVVRLSNSAFQDIVFRAKLHPKRKASELSVDERQALYDAIKKMLRERLQLRGKDQFTDLYGNRGGYTPAMGPNLKGRNCPRCGTPIERLSVGGGEVFLCPECQT
jgi:formamidopyrimidine-DNA glycosylase